VGRPGLSHTSRLLLLLLVVVLLFLLVVLVLLGVSWTLPLMQLSPQACMSVSTVLRPACVAAACVEKAAQLYGVMQLARGAVVPVLVLQDV
jgi:hypothetical protein